jgi:hypothetical protein
LLSSGLRLQISVTYREYVPPFAALAADTLLPLCGISPVRGITCTIFGDLPVFFDKQKRAADKAPSGARSPGRRFAPIYGGLKSFKNILTFINIRL